MNERKCIMEKLWKWLSPWVKPKQDMRRPEVDWDKVLRDTAEIDGKKMAATDIKKEIKKLEGDKRLLKQILKKSTKN